MAAARKTVTIHYRRFLDSASFQGKTLEAAIRQSMEFKEKGVSLSERYALRILETGEDNLFINNYHDGRNDGFDLVFGDIIHFTKGHLQALFDAGQKDLPSASVQQMPAPEKKEYVHSLMFWMVKDNHVFVIQSTSLRTESLESYMGWLLGLKTKTVNVGTGIVLASKFDGEAVGGDLSDIQELVIGGVATLPPTAPPATEQPINKVVEVTQDTQIETMGKTGWDQAWDILSTLLGGTANVEEMMKSVPQDAELSVEVHIGYKTKKRKVDRAALKNMETGLRNLPDSQIHVKAKGGNKAADGSIRLHHNASIKLCETQNGDETRVGSLLDPADVLRAMKEAYDVLMANGKISKEA